MSAPVIMLISGKGGTGKSTAAALLGGALAQHGKRVLLVEVNETMRCLDVICGVCGKVVYDLADVLANRCAPEKAIAESTIYPNLFVMCAPYSDGRIQTDAFAVVIAQMRARFDVILLDVASGYGRPFSAACAVGTAALVTITPDAMAVRDGRVAADMLLDLQHVQVRLLLNRVPPVLQGRGVPDLDACIDAVGVQLIGVLPESEEMLHAFCVGTQLPAQGLAQRAFSALAQRICGHEVPLVIA